MKTWLVLDCHYLAHRAFHMTKGLSHKGKGTGVIFGFLKSISFLKDEFQTDRVAFCFEGDNLLRSKVYPPYKKKRKTRELTEQEKVEYESFAIQIHELRKRYLPKIGFRNVFCFRGYESDDVMAAIARDIPGEDEVIIVTGDSDLYQCIRDNVSVYSPAARKMMTRLAFMAKFGIRPQQWAKVKAIAGCVGDEVEGIKGVGELTAIRYVTEELNPNSKAFQSIRSREGKEIVRRNRRLVQLPYEGCPSPSLQEDNVTKKAWLEVCDMLGMKSIASHPPVATRKIMSYGKSV